MGIMIRKPGVATTVQDTGRFGYMGSGFSPSGVMDRRALRLANLLVDNDPDDCVLEFALAGPTLRFTTDTFIALTGADFSARLDGAEAPLYRALPVHRGSKLSFGAPRRGVYGYIAFAGGSLSVAKVMGSHSTNLKCSLGGWHGRTLAPNDYIPFAQKETDYLPMQASHELPYDDIYPKPGEIVELRVIPGPQEELFTDAGIKTFWQRHHFRWHRLRCCTGALAWAAHYYAGRPSNNRWIRKNCNGRFGGYSQTGAKYPRNSNIVQAYIGWRSSVPLSRTGEILRSSGKSGNTPHCGWHKPPPHGTSLNTYSRTASACFTRQITLD